MPALAANELVDCLLLPYAKFLQLLWPGQSCYMPWTSVVHLLCLQPVLPGTAAQTVLKDALAVLEFFTTFRHLWPEDPLDLATLQHAALWPLDSTTLAQLYSTLLGILLHDHVSPRPWRSRSLAVKQCVLLPHVQLYILLRCCSPCTLGSPHCRACRLCATVACAPAASCWASRCMIPLAFNRMLSRTCMQIGTLKTPCRVLVVLCCR